MQRSAGVRSIVGRGADPASGCAGKKGEFHGRATRRGRSGPWVGGWHLGPSDWFTVADLDGDGRDELFVRSPAWAGVLKWEKNGWVCSWISGSPDDNANWVDGWHLGPLGSAVL